MKFVVSAPGKAILHGEHAVVYGKSAVAASLSLKTILTLSSQEKSVQLNLKSLGIAKEWDDSILNSSSFQSLSNLEAVNEGSVTQVNEDILQKITEVFGLDSTESEADQSQLAIVAFLYLWIYISKCYNNGLFIPCVVEVDSELGIGAGMGSSASYSVCLSTAMLVLCGRMTPRLLPEDKLLINQWAFQAEGIFHGKPSGLDNSICTFGGAVLYSDGKIVDKVTDLPNIHILLVNTRIPRNTKLLVEKVKQKKELYPKVIESIMEGIGTISKKAWDLLRNLHGEPAEPSTLDFNGTLKKLEDLFHMNHHLLNALDVGHPKLDQIYAISKRYSCASKLTGAGGGGCAIVLLYPEIDFTTTVSLKDELENTGFEVHDVFMGCAGVQVEFLLQ